MVLVLKCMQDQVVPSVGLGGDLKDIFAQRNWSALKSLFDGLILRKGLDVGRSRPQ